MVSNALVTRKHICLLVLILLSFPGLSLGGSEEKMWGKYEKERNSYIDALSDTVFSCVSKNDTRHYLFHGCIDWHSSVHGYWALLRASKYVSENKKKQYLDFVVNSIVPASVEKERRFLSQKKNFEMPYGRAWFLRLAIEYESVTDLKTLRLMADEVAQSLVDHYTVKSPVPFLGEYDNAEWAFRNLYDYAVYTKNEKIKAFVESQVKKVFLPIEVKFNFGDDKKLNPEFFSRVGNYFHLLEATVDSQEFSRVLNSLQFDYDSMRPVQSYENNHHLSINYSRAWGLWSIYKKTNDLYYRNAYLKNIEAIFLKHNEFKDQYRSYGHWVSQFGIYAITCSIEGLDNK